MSLIEKKYFKAWLNQRQPGNVVHEEKDADAIQAHQISFQGAGKKVLVQSIGFLDAKATEGESESLSLHRLENYIPKA